MVENKSTIFGLIALIVGAAGLGVGAYSVVNFQVVEGPQGLPGEDGQDGIDGIDGVQGPPGSLGILVGLWETLSRNTNYAPYNTNSFWLIEVGDVQIHNSKYFYLNNSNTRFILNKSGWFRVNIFALLDFGGTVNAMALRVYKDDILLHQVFRDEGETDEQPYYHIADQFYISSNGTNYYEFVISGSPDINFYVGQDWHQLAIEYLGE
jgi:hypothetical protein